MGYQMGRPTPNFRWIGFYIQADCCEHGYNIHLGLWWINFHLWTHSH